MKEVKHLNNPPGEALVKLLMKPVAWYFRYAELDKVVLCQQLSAFDESVSVSKQRPVIGVERSAHPLVSRSGNRLPLGGPEKESAYLSDILKEIGYDLVLSRQVWYMDACCGVEDASVQRGFARASKKNGYEVVNGKDLSDDELDALVGFVQLLYLQKYSYYNPQFTFDFLKLARDEEILHMYGLKTDGQLNA